jgi:hypothetical protein
MLVGLDERLFACVPRVLVIAKHPSATLNKPLLIPGDAIDSYALCSPARQRATTAASSVSTIKYTAGPGKLESR